MAHNGGIRYTGREENWYFTKEELDRTPSTKHMDKSKELISRQQAASFIQDMGLRLKVSQVIINTSVVYMHRFYMHHSFKVFHRNHIATACIFLACKIEEQPIRIFEIVKVSLVSKGQSISGLDRKTPEYLQLEERIKNHEILLLQTLGFEVAIDHPHHYLLKGTQLVKMTRDIAQISYFMAHNSLLLTTMCLEYKPQTVACVCINLSCRWKDIVIPLSSENKHWWKYIDPSLTQEKLTDLTFEFLDIIGSCPSRLKTRIEEYCKNRTAPGPSPSPLPPALSSPVPAPSARGSSSLPEAKRARYSSDSSNPSHFQDMPRPNPSSQPPPTRPYTAVATATNSGYQPSQPPPPGTKLSGPRASSLPKAYPPALPDHRQERQRKDTQQQQQQQQTTQYQQLPPLPPQLQQQQQQQPPRHLISSYKIPHRDDSKRI